MKQVMLLRGVSGSGKSTLALTLAAAMNGVAVSADDYFTDEDGNYNWTQEKLVDAHQDCMRRTVEALTGTEYDAVIVHNTATMQYDVYTYKEIAEEYGAKFTSLVVENWHGNSNVHNVPEKDTQRQALTLIQNLRLTPGLDFDVTVRREYDASKLQVVEFLKQYPTVDEGLAALLDRYKIGSDKLNGKILLKYNIDANKNTKIARECRGLILSEADLSVVSLPFEKFYNYLEPYAANDIDVKDSVIFEKVDGTNFTLYYDQINSKWCVQTLGQIEAQQVNGSWGDAGKGTGTWAQLFWNIFSLYNDGSILNELDKDMCYIFELCSLFNQVVIEYKDPKLFLLGIRNKITLKEERIETSILYDIFDHPKTFAFGSIGEMRKACRTVLTDQEEGYVVMDSKFRRVKMKSVEYVKQHFIHGGNITINDVAAIIYAHEEAEWLIAFPQFKSIVSIIKNELYAVAKNIESKYKEVLDLMQEDTGKEFARIAFSMPDFHGKEYMFDLYNKKIKKAIEGLMYYSSEEQRLGKIRKFMRNSNVAEKLQLNAQRNLKI